jgi:P pilus assembly chaperone PapD
MLRWIVLAALCGYGLLASASSYALAVDRMVVNLGDKLGTRYDLQVSNPSKERVYAEVVPSQILYPGTSQEQTLLEKDPRKLGLLISPRRFALNPGEVSLVRIALTQPLAATDRVYELKVRPVSLPITIKNADQQVATAIKLVVAYVVRVYVRPLQAKPTVEMVRQENTVTVTNRGNSNVLLIGQPQCQADQCKKLPARRLFAGNTWVFQAPYAQPVQFKQEFITEKTDIASN